MQAQRGVCPGLQGADKDDGSNVFHATCGPSRLHRTAHIHIAFTKTVHFGREIILCWPLLDITGGTIRRVLPIRFWWKLMVDG